ncbi:CatB-related O-acetyltransferase [Effusibacillus lacus]|uniref:Acetyltransferase n=1 Tax=Effusibacillus lacus TaxID=1348429 RepID=A0A292YU50_9BACL|nr:CatB-related O-acetyltransferase [Effusibacillus lacus]TCS73520.1 transferase family hexapeptide repeat protein [Effusibacillus lacus]GAX91984.1 acetyltransferase [Effusibacillus lacus]
MIFTNQISHYSIYEVGDWTYGTPQIYSYGDGTTLRIGKFCSMADGVILMLGGEHRSDWVTTYPFNPIFPEADQYKGHPKTKGDINIGHDVWIGKDALILSGVTIGNGAVIGARSVVTRNVPPYAIVGGNPAKIIRFRFPQDVIDELQKIAWWNWNLEQIREAWPLLLSGNVNEFIAKYRF